MSDGKIIFGLFFILFCVPAVISDHRNLLRLCKIECEFIDTLSSNYSCKIKALGHSRTAIYLDLYLKRPSDHVLVHMQAFRKNSIQYLPFMVNTTFNGCKLLAGASQSFFGKFMKDWIQPFSNFNHPCPYSGHVYVQELEPFPDRIPVPVAAGDYRLDLHFYEKTFENWIGTVRGYGTITKKLFMS